MRRTLASLILCALGSLAAAQAAPPAPPHGWTIQAAVNAGYVGQSVTDEVTGKVHDEFTVTALSGIQFWRDRSIFGFSAGVAALPDEQENLPRVAPYLALHLGTADAQIFVGAAYDPQDPDRTIRPTFGFTAAFGGGS